MKFRSLEEKPFRAWLLVSLSSEGPHGAETPNLCKEETDWLVLVSLKLVYKGWKTANWIQLLLGRDLLKLR